MSAAGTAPEGVIVPSWRDKGIWAPAASVASASATGEERAAIAGYLAGQPSLFGGSCAWPVMVLREDALEQNIRALADFAARHELLFAPHGKTTMAPQLWRRQIDAGAWGITVATPAQLLIARRAGVARVLLANEVLDITALDWIATELATDSAFEFACFVDSAAGCAPSPRPVWRVRWSTGRAAGSRCSWTSDSRADGRACAARLRRAHWPILSRRLQASA